MEKSSRRALVIGGVRTPFVRARGVFKELTASHLGGAVLRETMARSTLDPKLIEEVYFGIVSPPSEGTNVARESLFDSGLPASIPCTTINRYCASSLEAVAGIVAKIESEQIEIGLAGGVESLSSVRALFSQEATDFFQNLVQAKTLGQRLQFLAKFHPKLFMPFTPGIKEASTGLSMGQSAELMTREFEISREAQDDFAALSHRNAHRGWEEGFYSSHVIALGTPEGKLIDRDTDIRSEKDSLTSREKLRKLRPAFYPNGSITAGNASPLTDGASALLLASEMAAKRAGLNPIGSIRSIIATGVDIKKEALLIAPAYAIPKALKKAHIKWEELDLIEIHEAFAGQVLSTLKALESAQWAQEKLGFHGPIVEKIDREKINIYGGSIAIGHPFGATGGRLILQTLHALHAKKKKLGLISICAAGGLGMVAVVEAI